LKSYAGPRGEAHSVASSTIPSSISACALLRCRARSACGRPIADARVPAPLAGAAALTRCAAKQLARNKQPRLLVSKPVPPMPRSTVQPTPRQLTAQQRTRVRHRPLRLLLRQPPRARQPPPRGTQLPPIWRRRHSRVSSCSLGWQHIWPTAGLVCGLCCSPAMAQHSCCRPLPP
jgi:hypothetical protein